MDALGSWSIPQRVPVSNFRNQQQSAQLSAPIRQTAEYSHHKQQPETLHHAPEQAYHRDIYSAGRGMPEQQNPNPIYNNIRVDPNLQNAGAHAQHPHIMHQHPRTMQMQPLPHLANHQQVLPNAEGQRQRRPSHNVQQLQHTLQHVRTSKPPSWDQKAPSVPVLDTHIPTTDKASSINGFSGGRLQLSPQNYQLQTPAYQDSQTPSGVYRPTNQENNARRHSGQTPNPQVQVNEKDRSAHPAINGQMASASFQQENFRQMPSRDSGMVIQVPPSASEVTASSTPQLSAFRVQHNPSQTDVNSTGVPDRGQLLELSRTVERLVKAQSDMFVFLQTEMSRRKTWEEQCLHEIRRQNSHTGTSLTRPTSHNGSSLIPNVDGKSPSAGTLGMGNSGDVYSNNNRVAFPHTAPFSHTEGSNMSIHMANEMHRQFIQRATNGVPDGDMTYPDPISTSQPPSTIMGPISNFPSTAGAQNHANDPPFAIPLNSGTSNGQASIPSDAPGPNALASLPPPPNDTSTSGIPTEPIGNDEPALNVTIADDGETPTKPEEVTKQKKRPRTDSNIESERAGKRFAVNERGIVYMAGGSTKSTQTPTKIQSIVRKTLYASMGIAQDLEGSAMPIYIQDMTPPDGSEDWRFGNLRFDWNSTMRRCAHNKKMRDIVLDHIIGLRNEYSEIAEPEFVRARLEQAFDQAFATWKGKYLGKRSGGIRRTATTTKKQTQAEAPTPTQQPDTSV